jgi:hypothetical protein
MENKTGKIISISKSKKMEKLIEILTDESKLIEMFRKVFRYLIVVLLALVLYQKSGGAIMPFSKIDIQKSIDFVTSRV